RRRARRYLGQWTDRGGARTVPQYSTRTPSALPCAGRGALRHLLRQALARGSLPARAAVHLDLQLEAVEAPPKAHSAIPLRRAPHARRWRAAGAARTPR